MWHERKNILYGISCFILVNIFFTFIFKNSFLTTCFFTLGTCLFYLPVIYTCKISKVGLYIQNITRKELISIVVISMVILAYVYQLVNSNEFVYYWDYSGYWCISTEYKKMLYSDIKDVYSHMINSINFQEYNVFTCIPMVIYMEIMGEDFLTYILGVCILFYFPLYINLVIIFYIIKSKLKIEKYNSYIIPYIIPFTCPFFLSPILSGYIDCSGLLMLSSLIILYLNYEHETFNFKINLLISILMVQAVIIRRWYAFFIVAFMMIFLISELYICIKNKSIKYIKNFMFIGIMSLFILFFFFRNLFFTFIQNQYSFSYQAYGRGEILDKIFDLLNYFGIAIIIIIVFSVVISKKLSLLMWSWIVFTVVLFYRVQNMGLQHRYLLCIPIYILIVISILAACKYNKKIYYICIMVLIFNMTYSYMGGNNHILSKVFTSYTNKPLIRNDISELKRMSIFLEELYEKYGYKSYILASSNILNSDIMYKLDYPKNTPNYLLDTAHVDLRDGFPVSFLSADIVVVTSPVQYHLLPDDQRVVGLLSEEFIYSRKISLHFKEIKWYTLDNDVKAIVYQKINDFTTDDLEYLSELFDQYYGEYSELFRKRIVGD